MTYQEQQLANTAKFNELTAEEQQSAREAGYRNVGKEGVAKSAEILEGFSSQVSSEVEVVADIVTESADIVQDLTSKLAELEGIYLTTLDELEEVHEEAKELTEDGFFADMYSWMDESEETGDTFFAEMYRWMDESEVAEDESEVAENESEVAEDNLYLQLFHAMLGLT